MIGSKPKCHDNAVPLSQLCHRIGTIVTKEWHNCDTVVTQAIQSKVFVTYLPTNEKKEDYPCHNYL